MQTISRSRSDKLEASEEVKETHRAKRSSRFKNAGNNSAESSVIRGYIETLLELPWDKASEDNMDLNNAREILEEDHYGLEKVKERVYGISGSPRPDEERRQPDPLSGGTAGNR